MERKERELIIRGHLPGGEAPHTDEATSAPSCCSVSALGDSLACLLRESVVVLTGPFLEEMVTADLQAFFFFFSFQHVISIRTL